MDSDLLLAEIQGIFRDIFDDPSLLITRDSSADTVDEWDSLTHVSLVTTIEKRYKVKFALGELQELNNVGDLMRYLERKLAARQGTL